MIVIFSFLSGIAGATSLSNVAATVSDLFQSSDSAGQPMALFVAGGSIGPVAGNLIGSRILQDGLGFKWLFLINVIIGFGLACILGFVPETLTRLVKTSASRSTVFADQESPPPFEAFEPRSQGSNSRTVYDLTFAFTESFRLLLTQPIILFTGIFNGIANGILLLFITGLVTDYLTVKNLT